METNEIIESTVSEIVLEGKTEQDLLIERLNEALYDENIDYNSVIDTYLNMDYELRYTLVNDYLRALYMLLVNSNVPIETYLEELHTMVLMQQIPMCVPEDLWYDSFGNLIKVSNECPSLYDMFIELAIYAHELSCEKEHSLNDYYAYSCDELEEEYKLVRGLKVE